MTSAILLFKIELPITNSRSAGIAWVELSSGAFWAMTVPPGQVLDELTRIRPAEVLLAESGPMEMGGSSTEHHVGCRSCGAGVRTEDPLRSRQGWNRRVER